MSTRSGRLLALLGVALLAVAHAADYATPAEAMRSRLAEAATEVSFDPAQAVTLVQQARAEYLKALDTPLSSAAPAAAAQLRANFATAVQAAQRGDEPGYAAAQAHLWTLWLGGAYSALAQSVQAGRAADARDWLATREFQQASRFTRLNADATTAVEALAAGKLTPADAMTAVQADVQGGYQSRLNDALNGIQDAQNRGYRTRAAEQSALASGYFALLAPAFQQARGTAELSAVQAQFRQLPGSLKNVQRALEGFRAAPLSEREQRLRAGQVLRFLNLVPVEYSRAVDGPAGAVTVKRDIEIVEAKTFLAGTVSAYSDLAPLLKDQEAVRQSLAQLGALGEQLEAAAAHRRPPTAAALQTDVTQALTALQAQFPAAWKQHDASGDLDVIRSQLGNMLAAVGAGNYEQAETARLDAYATLESGPEARIAVFAPDLKLRLENLFWNGDSPAGLARLIRDRAPLAQVKASRAQLDQELAQTGELLGTEQAPAAVATNAGVIVFREGLEAVLILAALMGSLRRPEVRHLRRPMWWGAALAFAATAVTWFVMSGTLSLFARFGEKLEAVISVLAIAVLLIIMNWFVHQVYWNDRMADFQKTKHSLMGQNVGQWVGLTLLGFTSIYREGFETVLFLQSLALQSGSAPVLSGTGLGLAAVVGVGVLVFALQAKLPMKKLLVWTGMMICAVLAVMVGNTVHVLQLVGWFPVHGVVGLELPSWASLWLGVYPTWEGLVSQVLAVILVVGSYFLSEAIKERRLQRKLKQSRQHGASSTVARQ
ncbi:FTR1 family protein [Deinococcus sp. KNUC1210]|uniref:FTR1 family protein n=1 Tax=Deinococcus sp. KNUC1210 TaxID=2917691 RepID=UPI001EEF994E|nr:FTR1 family protein [Deinococcus sp. KNUC1210]ULH14987.1 FTR1 family protein [Deinococcus sp. KNUC1210]